MNFSPYTGPPDAALFQAVLRTVTYQNNKPNPTPGPRTMKVVVSSGTTTASAAVTINVQGSGTTSTTPFATTGFSGQQTINTVPGNPLPPSTSTPLAPLQVNYAPSVDLSGMGSGNDATSVTGNGNTVLIAPSGTVSGGMISSMTITLTSRPDGANEFLSCNWNLNTVSRSSTGYNASTGQIVFSGLADQAQYQAVLRTVTYQDNKSSATGGNRSIQVVVTNVSGVSVVKTATVSVIGSTAYTKPPVPVPIYTPLSTPPARSLPFLKPGGINPALTLNLNAFLVNATGNGNKVFTMPNATATGGTCYSMTVYLLNRPDGDQEYLSCNWNLNAISRSASGYNSSGGYIFFSGPGTASDYAAVLRTITYQDDKPNPTVGNRAIKVELSDGTTVLRPTMAVSVTSSGSFTTGKGQKTVQAIGVGGPAITPVPGPVLTNQTQLKLGSLFTAAPSLNLGGPGGNYSTTAVGGSNSATYLAPNGTVSGSNLTSMTVTLTNRPDSGNDWLNCWTGSTGLSSSPYNPYTGQLVITGSGTSSAYQQVLRTVTYSDANPTATVGNRYIQFVVSTGTTSSPVRTATVTVSRTNRKPLPPHGNPVTSVPVRTLPRLTPLFSSSSTSLYPPTGGVQGARPLFPRKFYLGKKDDLQTAIDQALPGDTIYLDPQATFRPNRDVGYSLFLRKKRDSDLFIDIVSRAIDRLPGPGRRVSPDDAINMPKVETTDVSNEPAIIAEAGAGHYRLIGIEIRLQSAALLESGSLVALESTNQTSLSDVPHDLVLDRCYIHAWPNQSVKRAIGLNSARTAITGCHISDIHLVGQDSQAINGWNGPGPYRIINNYLEAAGENVLFGGVKPAIQGIIPTSIVIQGNVLIKRRSWNPWDPQWYDGSQWRVKNLLEFKNAKQVLVDRNVLRNCWTPGQDGVGILVNLSAYGGWEATDDIVVTNNVVENTLSGVFVGAAIDPDLKKPDHAPTKVTVRNNLFKNLNCRYGGGQHVDENRNPEAPYSFRISYASDITIEHNTAVTDIMPSKVDGMTFGADMTGAMGEVKLTDNIFEWGQRPNQVPAGLMMYAGNVMVGGPRAKDNYSPPNWQGVGLADYFNRNYLNDNYRLAPNSPYRGKASDSTPAQPKDPGANIDVLPPTP